MRVKDGLMASVLAMTVLAPTAIAQDAQAVAAKFGALEAVQQISLSPDGSKVAYLVPHATRGTALYVADLTTGQPPKQVIASNSKDEAMYYCTWASDTRIICKISVIYNAAGQLLGFTRAFALNSDGTGAVQLTNVSSKALGIVQNGGSVIDLDVPGKPNSVLMTKAFMPEDGAGTLISQSELGLGVEEVDTATLKRRTVEKPRSDAVEYISDGRGNVRIMGTMPTGATGFSKGKIKYFYRKAGSSRWEELSTVDSTAAGVGGFSPYAVDATKNLVYGFEDKDGFSALYSMALDGSANKTLLLSRSDVDVDGLIRIGRDDRVVGASYATERRVTEFFDPDLKKLAAALGKALPGNLAISFIDSSADENKLLMIASSDTDPGKLYLFDKTTHKLGEVLPIRPELANMTMAPMQAVTFPAADGTRIPAYLTLPVGKGGKGLPAVVMPHGGPGARDEWGFDWLVQFYVARGFAVIQPNFRGSTGYGSAWYQKNGFQSWRTSVGDVNDAGRWLVSQGIASPDKLAIVGWSYGGYAALQSSVLDPKLFKAIVAIAPVTDLERLRAASREFANYVMVDKFIGTGPHVKEGSPAQNVDKLLAPVLMFHGDRDQNVAIAQSRFMADRLRAAGKQVQLVEFPGLAHSLTDSAARTRMLAESDAFLRKSLGLPAN